MRCSGCGKEIPFAGQVCPYCQRDKSADQGTQAIVIACVFIGGVIGFLVNGFMGFIVGAGIGCVGGIVAALSVSGSTISKPPVVRVVSEESTMTESSESDSVRRLSELDTLKSKGLITETEWSEKRQEILRLI